MRPLMNRNLNNAEEALTHLNNVSSPLKLAAYSPEEVSYLLIDLIFPTI